MQSYKENLAENIERLAKQKGVGKTAACVESGAGKSFISNMIGKNQVPSFDKVLQLAQYFEVSIDYLVGYSPKNEYDPKIEKLIKLGELLSDEQVDSLVEHYLNFVQPKK